MKQSTILFLLCSTLTQGGYNSLEAVYNYEPIPKELNAEQAKYILGGQGNLWSE